MSDLIRKADVLPIFCMRCVRVIDCANDMTGNFKNNCPIKKEVDDLPSAQPERKKGEWIKEDSIYETVTCSVCHGVRRDKRINHINFCNCCGADMRGEQNG